MLAKRTIKQKLLLCFTLIALALVGLAATFSVSIRHNTASFDTLLADRIQPLRDLKIVADAYAVAIVDAAHKARNGNFGMEEAASKVGAGRVTLAAHWKKYQATSISGREADLANQAAGRMREADQRVGELEAILRQGDRVALDTFVRGKLYQAIDPVSDAMGALIDEQIKIADRVTGDASDENRRASMIAAVLSLLAGCVWLFAAMLSRNSIIRPITKLAETMEALASDRSGVTIPYVEQHDEVGKMARACEVFRAAAVKHACEEEAAAANQRSVTAELQTAISAISSGDLTREIPDTFPKEYQAVRHDFNEALASLRDLIGAVTESAGSIHTGSGEIAQASEDLARRTESNAASLEQTSAAITQIDKRLKGTAAAASETVQRAEGAIDTVSSGRSVADEAVLAMGRVSDSAKGIDSVIAGLDKIAFQTRVLAMNAAVEAGRAGDSGRGFAVVADLVSALAMRAEEEAKRARDQITVTQTEIVCAVELVQKVDGALAEISADVGQVHELLATMAADNQAQSSAITQIASAVSTMDKSTQQNAAMVEETSAAARNLTSEVQALSDQANRFKIEPDGPRSTLSVDVHALRPEPKPQTAPYLLPVKPLSAAAVSALTRPKSHY